MGLSTRPAGEGLAEPDLNPLVDIAFLLLLFFILATTFLKAAGSRMEIPAGQNSQAQATSLTVNISANDIRWGEKAQAVSIDQLRSLLVAERLPERKDASQRLVVLDSATDVPFQRYFEVVMAINQAGGVLALVDADEDEGTDEAEAPATSRSATAAAAAAADAAKAAKAAAAAPASDEDGP
ncbi:MAG TPA: biopolymer transporter ExbD [Planctomycetota bacterium]|nr:biopolymer transporter ExbD [Planctomycetota bacterium]